MPVHIRPVRFSDVPALVALETAAFEGNRISPRGFRAMTGSSSACILVAEKDAGMCGYCALLFRANSAKARLYSLAAKPGLSGVGRLLLAEAETTAQARGASELRLEVRADNARAIGLYEKNGYRAFGRIDAYYADGAAALRFRKPLVGNGSQMPGT